MIESLKNTCVMPESQEQVRAILALYEAVGGQISGVSTLPRWYTGRSIGIVADGDILHVNEGFKRITFHELCWNYGIAPDWAKALVEWGGEYFWRGDEHYQSLKSDNIFEYSEDGLIASREPISTRPTKQPKRKTLQNALEAFPDGSPYCGYGNPKGQQYILEDIESGEMIEGCDGFCTDTFRIVCTREEFEAAHAKRLAEKEWPDPGTLPPVEELCEYYWAEGEEWRRATCVAHHNGCAVVVDDEDGAAECCTLGNVRPIQSERDRLVELALKAANCRGDDWNAVGIIKDLHDAGMLKDPQQ